MSALSIQPTYPIFTETDGLPLENGYIWIGAANLDPQGNPINVYWDAALTIAAPQPIRTLNGYPSRNGTPGRLYVNSDYSIRVQNSKGSMVYSAPAATERYNNVVVSTQNADDVIYDPPFANGVQTNVEAKLSQYVSVIDFGADPTGVADSTAAIQAAQQASKYVYCPPGDYSVTGLRIYNRVNLIGAGYENTRFLQRDPNQAAINCLSDATVGQLLSLRLENFGVRGHPSATVAAVKIEALGAYAIYRSHFDMIISRCYQALNMQAITANNVFYCTFRMDIVGTQTTSVVLNGGTYNTYDFFIAQVGNGRMIEHGGFNNTFIRLVGEGQVFCNGQNIIYFSPTIEELFNNPPTPYGFYLNGFNQTLITPTIILNPTSSARITHCIRPFAASSIINPRFIVNGTLNPFETAAAQEWALQGPGQNSCVNKMEVVYDGSNDATDLRKVFAIGDVIDFISKTSGTYSGKTVQYLAPNAGVSINYQILNSTDAMIFEPAGTVTLINVNIGYVGCDRKEGQTLSIYTSQAITTLNWSGNGSDVSLFPASMTPGQTVRFVYNSGTSKWYPY